MVLSVRILMKGLLLPTTLISLIKKIALLNLTISIVMPTAVNGEF